MSIRINNSKCVGCQKCSIVCPGNLIYMKDKKASINIKEDCWGCTACMKECKFEAIELILGKNTDDTKLTYKKHSDLIEWKITKDDNEILININPKDSNSY